MTGPHQGWTTVYGEERCDRCGTSRELYDDDPEMYDVCDPEPPEPDLNAVGASERYMADWQEHQRLHAR